MLSAGCIVVAPSGSHDAASPVDADTDQSPSVDLYAADAPSPSADFAAPTPDFAITPDLALSAMPDLSVSPDLRTPTTYGGDYSWCKGGGATTMTPVASSACFLTGVSGAFSGGGEWVEVQQSGNDWVVNGGSAQPLTCAQAGCLANGPMLTGLSSWCQGDADVALGPSNDRVCFLTHMSGHFQGGGEYIQTFISNGQWYLKGGSSQTAVCGAARCLLTSSYGSEVRWCQGSATLTVGPFPHQACFLTAVAGGFAGGGEAVALTHDANLWYLGGKSGQSGTCALARCVSY